MLIPCLLLLQLFVGVLCLFIALLFSTLCPSFAIVLMRERERESLLLYFNCLLAVL